MSPPFGLGWEVCIGSAVVIVIAILGVLWKFASWKGGLDQWKNSIEDWRKKVDDRFDKLGEDIRTLMSDVSVIKSAQEKDATRNGMIQRHSPLVPSKKAIEILDELNIISQIDANLSTIQDEIDKRSQTSVYRDIKDPEERFVDIAPAVINDLTKKGKIDEKKIDEAMKKLERCFPVVTYYGVLLLIAAYILERQREKGFIAKPSIIYSQIDMAVSKGPAEILALFDGDPNKAIKSLVMSIRSLEKIGDKTELSENKFILANIYADTGRTKEAEKEYKEALRIDPDNAEARNNFGTLLYRLKRFKEAKKEYKEAIQTNPDLAEAHSNLGRLFYESERFEKAEKEYRKAIRIQPDYAGIHNNLGILLIDLERYEEAENEFREAIRIQPNDAQAHNNLGVVLINLERHEEAENEFREAIRINPDYAETHANLGILYTQTGRVEDAKKELESAKRLFEEQGRAEDAKKTEKLLKSL